LGTFFVLAYIFLIGSIFSSLPVESSDFENVPASIIFYIALGIFAFILIYGTLLIIAGTSIREKTVFLV
jgi:hypothetical protein